jgi:hypothetical protein
MGQKKDLAKVQHSTPVTPSGIDMAAIEHVVDLKFLEFERNKLYSECLQQKPSPRAQEPKNHAPTPANSPRPPPMQVQVQPAAASGPEQQDPDEKQEVSGEEPLELLEAVDDNQPKEMPPKTERQPVEPPKVRRRLGFRRLFQQTDYHGEPKIEEKAHVPKNQEPKGQLVFSKDTGEKLGVITDVVYDGHHNIIGYTLQTGSAKTAFHYPVDQFSKGKQGLLFVPNWYRNAIGTIEKLEFLDKVSPELPGLMQNGMFNEELFDLLMKRDEHFSEYLDEAIELKELLLLQIQLLEERRRSLSEKANALMVKRVMEEITRNSFAENVQVLRRKIRLLDLNIQQCTKLLQRLNYTSVGVITDHFVEPVEPQHEEPQQSLRAPGKKPQQHTEAYPQDHEPGFAELIAQLVEEKIMTDLKRQMTQEKLQRQRTPSHDETERYPPTISSVKDDENA